MPHQSVKVYVPQVFLVELSPPELARFDRADSYHRHETQSIATTFNTSLAQPNALMFVRYYCKHSPPGYPY